MKTQTNTDWELWFYENSCDPEEHRRVEDQLEAGGLPAHLLIGQENTGFAGGHDAMFHLHHAPFVLVLNEDAYLDEEYIDACLRRFSQDGTCASVTGIVYRWTSEIDQVQDVNEKTLIDTTGLEYRCLADVVDRFSGKTWGEMRSRLSSSEKIFGVSGAIAMYKREAVEAVSPDHGFYEPRFFMYKEDVDLAIRLHRKGFAAWFDPRVMAFHRRSIKSQSKGVMARIREERQRPAHLRRAMYRNQWWIYVSHLSFSLGLKDLVRSFFIEKGRKILTFIASPIVLFSAWAEIFGSWGWAWKRRGDLKRVILNGVKDPRRSFDSTSLRSG